MAGSAIINAVWDLIAKIDNKPIWIFVEMTPEKFARYYRLQAYVRCFR